MMRRYSQQEVLRNTKLEILLQKAKAMRVPDSKSMFHFTYEKSSEEIIFRMTAKLATINAKIIEREARIRDARTAHQITDDILIKLLMQARQQAKEDRFDRMSYSVSNTVRKQDGSVSEESVLIGAGVVNMLMTETDFLEEEKSSVARLELIIRNLKDLPNHSPPHEIKGHQLTEAELTWLGF